VGIVAAGLLVAFTGGSRATIGLFAIGLVITLMLSLWRKSTGRKAALAGALILVLFISLPFLQSAVERRSAKKLEDSNIERSEMIKAAKMMIADHPLGVGANRYVVVANIGGYSDRAGLAWNQSNRRTPVHNTYYLVTAEMGWFGLFALISLLASIIGVGLRAVHARARGFEGDLVLGVTVTMIIFAVHSYFEWITMSETVQYLVGIAVGLLIGLRARMRSKQQPSRTVPAPVARIQLAGNPV